MRPTVLFTTSTLPRWESDPQPRFVVDLAVATKEWLAPELLSPAFPGACELESILFGVPHHLFRYAPDQLQTLAYSGGIPTQLRQHRWKWGLVPGFLAGMHRRISRLCAEGRIDAVVANWMLPQGIVQSFVPRVPYVLYVHGADAYTMNNGFMKLLKRRSLRRARHVFVVSHAMQRQLLSQFPELSPAKLTRLPTGANTAVFGAHRTENDCYGELTRPIVLFAGRLDRKKGVSTLIAAWHRERSGPGGRGTLVIVGGGPLEEELKAQAASGPAAASIVFLPPVTHTRLPVFMASADAFCCPSVLAPGGDREGRPTVLVEAAASQLPILASRIDGIDEFVIDGENGLLVPPGDVDAWAAAIRRLLCDPELRSRLGQAGRKSALMEDWRVVAERASRVITGCLSEAGSA